MDKTTKEPAGTARQPGAPVALTNEDLDRVVGGGANKPQAWPDQKKPMPTHP